MTIQQAISYLEGVLCGAEPLETDIDDIIDLLREQEPVPVNVRREMDISGGTCPKCLNWIQRQYNYCPFCGKAVEWRA